MKLLKAIWAVFTKGKTAPLFIGGAVGLFVLLRYAFKASVLVSIAVAIVAPVAVFAFIMFRAFKG